MLADSRAPPGTACAGLCCGAAVSVRAVRAGAGGGDLSATEARRAATPPAEPSPVAGGAEAMADAAYYAYLRHTGGRGRPNLWVDVPDAVAAAGSPVVLELEFEVVGPAPRGAAVALDDWAAVGLAGGGFAQDVFPCVDVEGMGCPWSLELRVPSGFTAVACGIFEAQEPHGDKGWQLFRYRVPSQAEPSQLAFVVGPMGFASAAALRESSGLGETSALRALPTSAHAPQRALETATYTAAPILRLQEVCSEYFGGEALPFESLQLSFLPLDMALSDFSTSPGLIALSSDILVDKTAIEQGVESLCVLARAVSQMWFGQWFRAASPDDLWVVLGFAQFFESLCVKKFLGNNEMLYRRLQQRRAIVAAEDAPPLCPRSAIAKGARQNGTQLLSSDLRRLQYKAGAVMHIMERKAGAEGFQKMLQLTLSASKNQEADRHLSTRTLFRDLHRICGLDRAWLEAFAERWVYGRGCPSVNVAFCYNKKRHSLELAISQEGSEHSMVSANASMLRSTKGGSGGAGMVAVQVEELGGLAKHAVHLGDQPLVLSEYRCISRIGGKKQKRLLREINIVKDLDGDTVMEDEEAPAYTITGPIKYVRLDPDMDWFATVKVNQPEPMWGHQLQISKDVVAQSEAIAGLSAIKPQTYSVVNLLTTCLRNKKVFYRVRAEAADALGRTADSSTNWAGLDNMTKFYRESVYGEDSLMRPNDFSDLSEHLVRQSIPLAVAVVRDADGNSPAEAIDFLIEIMDNNDNRGNIYSDDNFLASNLHALGLCKPSSSGAQQRVLAVFQRHLSRDAARPSFHNVVTKACLRSLVYLASSFEVSDPLFAEAHQAARAALEKKHHSGAFHGVKRAVHDGAITLALILGSVDAPFEILIEFLQSGESSQLERQAITDATSLLKDSLPKKQLLHVSAAVHCVLEEMMLGKCEGIVDSSIAQHRVFELVQVMGNRPPGLYRASAKEAHASVLVRRGGAAGQPAPIVPPTVVPHLPIPAERNGSGPKMAQTKAPSSAEKKPPTKSQNAQNKVSKSKSLADLPSRNTSAVPALKPAPKPAPKPVPKPAPKAAPQKPKEPPKPAVPQPITKTTLPNGVTLRVGQEIEAKGTNHLWHPAKILEIQRNGHYMILFDDGALTRDTPLSYIRPVGGWNTKVSAFSPPKPAPAVQAPKKTPEEIEKEAQRAKEIAAAKEKAAAKARADLLANLLQTCSKVLRFLTQRDRLAFPFMKPVEPEAQGIPDYLEIIKEPMDFGTIQNKLKDRAYASPLGFRDDVRQVFENCMRYNPPGSDIRDKGDRLSGIFEKKWLDSSIERLWAPGSGGAPEPSSLARLKSMAKLKRSQSSKIDENVERIWTACTRILKNLKDHQKSAIFLEPVDWKALELFDYPEIVKNPMDFRTITEKLAARRYSSPAGFKDDVRLTFQNCCLYNSAPENEYRLAAEELSAYFEQRWIEADLEAKMERFQKEASGNLTPEDLGWRECERTLDILKKSKESWPFKTPVDPVALQCPHYFEIVKKPMDLSTIATKLKKKEYENVAGFRDDVRLIFHNCKLFNRPEDPVYKSGTALLEIFEKRWESSEIEEKVGLRPPRPHEEDLGNMDVSTPDGQLWKKCLDIWRSLFDHDSSEPFRAQVDRAADPRYYSVVTSPVDLGTMGWKMKRGGRGSYSSPIDVKRDILKIFENCKLYYTDPSSHPRKCAAEMEAIFHERWEEAGIDAGWKTLHPKAEAPAKISLPKVKLTNVPSKKALPETAPSSEPKSDAVACIPAAPATDPPAAGQPGSDAAPPDAAPSVGQPAAEAGGASGSPKCGPEAGTGEGPAPEGSAPAAPGPSVLSDGAQAVVKAPEAEPASGGEVGADKPRAGGLKLKINFGGQPSEKRPRTEEGD